MHNPGIVIKLFRVQQKLSQKALATKAQIDPSHLSHIEKGIRTPSLEVLDRLAGSLGVEVHTLLRKPEELEKHSAEKLFLLEQFAPVLTKLEELVTKLEL